MPSDPETARTGAVEVESAEELLRLPENALGGLDAARERLGLSPMPGESQTAEDQMRPVQATDMYTLTKSIAAFDAARNLPDIARALFLENVRLRAENAELRHDPTQTADCPVCGSPLNEWGLVMCAERHCAKRSVR